MDPGSHFLDTTLPSWFSPLAVSSSFFYCNYFALYLSILIGSRFSPEPFPLPFLYFPALENLSHLYDFKYCLSTDNCQISISIPDSGLYNQQFSYYTMEMSVRYLKFLKYPKLKSWLLSLSCLILSARRLSLCLLTPSEMAFVFSFVYLLITCPPHPTPQSKFCESRNFGMFISDPRTIPGIWPILNKYLLEKNKERKTRHVLAFCLSYKTVEDNVSAIKMVSGPRTKSMVSFKKVVLIGQWEFHYVPWFPSSFKFYEVQFDWMISFNN